MANQAATGEPDGAVYEDAFGHGLTKDVKGSRRANLHIVTKTSAFIYRERSFYSQEAVI